MMLIILIFIKHNNETVKIAHRGAAIGYQTKENTLNAIDTAYQNGYTIEMDIQFTKDNVPILNHNTNKNIQNVSYNSVKDKYTSFEDVLIWASDKNVTLYPELKYELTSEQIIILDNLLDKYNVDIVFQVSHVSNFNELNKKYEILVLPYNDYIDYTVDQLVKLSNEKNVYIGFNYDNLTEDDLQYIDNNMNKDIYWTINDKKDIDDLEKYTPYGIMTDEKINVF